MAVLQMQRISICALKHDRKAILEKLQSMGMIEMHQVAQDEAGFEKMDTQSAKSSFEKRVQITENALDVLNQYTPEKKSMFASLEGNELIDKKTMEAAAAKQEAVMEVAGLLIADHKKIAEAQAEIVKRNTQIEALTPWMSLEVAMNYPGTKKTSMLLGTMAAETTLEMIYGKLAEDHPEIEAVDISVISQDKDAVYLSVFCMKDQAADVENTLRTAGFSRPVVSTEQIPAKQKEELEEQIRQIEQTIADIRGEIISYAEDREELKIIGDYYRMRAEKYEVLGTLPQSRRTFIISGYAAKEAIPAIQKGIGDAYDCVIDVEELKEDEEPPVILKNNGFSESVEGVLESYGLPHKGEIDPTAIMSFFYVFFFGMMLSDAAYGCLLYTSGYHTLIDWDKTGTEYVNALIEVKVTPQRDTGFDKTAERICNYPEVSAVYLISGDFDMMVLIEGKTLQEVSKFVSSKLSPIEDVTGTSTQFVLKKYKDHGTIMFGQKKPERMLITP